MTAAGAKQPEQQQTVEKRPPSGTTVEVDCTVKYSDDHLIYHKGDFVDKRYEILHTLGGGSLAKWCVARTEYQEYR